MFIIGAILIIWLVYRWWRRHSDNVYIASMVQWDDATAEVPVEERRRATWRSRDRRRVYGLALLVVAVVAVGALLFRVLPSIRLSLFAGGQARGVVSESTRTVEIDAPLPLSGGDSAYGQSILEGIQMAVDEANAGNVEPRIKLGVFDYRSDAERLKVAAGKIVAGRAVLVLGPAYSTDVLAAGPIFTLGGISSLSPTATSDLITQNPTTFRMLFKNSDQGETIANYLVRVLGQHRASVIVLDNAYGATLRQGFERAAPGLGIQAKYYPFQADDEAVQVAKKVAADALDLPVVLFILDNDAAVFLPALRRQGVRGPFVGGDALGDQNVSVRMANEPEEQQQRGYFTEGLYGIAPVTLDSANAETLAFAQRFRTHFGHEPLWNSVMGYDSARFAISAVREAAPDVGIATDMRAPRAAVINYLLSLNSPGTAQPGLLGPFWFDKDRGRSVPIRMGRFNAGHLESAPLQLVPVTNPNKTELDSGAVFQTAPGRYARIQRVVFTSVFLNQISQVDPTGSTFNADFNLSMRFAHEAGSGSLDPTDVRFANLVSGGFDRSNPIEHRVDANGQEYWLWRVQGVFRADYDLHRYPFDRQSLTMSFAHAQASADEIVYTLDSQAAPAQSATGSQPVAAPDAPSDQGETASIVAADAFRDLVQWRVRDVRFERDSLVTTSTLGDPSRTGFDTRLEVSAMQLTVEVQRLARFYLADTLLPPLLLALILLGVLALPQRMIRLKVVVPLLVAVAGAALLLTINHNLGSTDYTVAAEYLVYVVFGLCLLSIVSTVSVERLRGVGRLTTARVTAELIRLVFLLIIVAVAVGVWRLYIGP